MAEEEEGKPPNKGDNWQSFSADVLQNLTNFIDRNVQVIRYSSYGLALVGSVLILRSTYAWHKFRHISEIPEQYIRTHVRLQGLVKDISSAGVLHIDHIPLISSRWTHQKGEGLLPVNLGGVAVLEPGYPWLQERLLGNKIWFTILQINQADRLDCILTAKKGWFRSGCINEEVIRLGLAEVKPLEGLSNDKIYKHLSDRLDKAQKFAQKKGHGIWSRPSMTDKIRAFPVNAKNNFIGYTKEKWTDLKEFIFFWKRKNVKHKESSISVQEGNIPISAQEGKIPTTPQPVIEKDKDEQQTVKDISKKQTG